MSEVTTAKMKDTKDGKPRKSISEIIEESNAKRRAKRRKEGPQPWIVLKFAVFLTSAIIIYACYVYIGRFVVPMLKRSPTALAGRSTGSAYMSGALGPSLIDCSCVIDRFCALGIHDELGLLQGTFNAELSLWPCLKYT